MRKVDIRTLRKWRHYAAHAKKFRTRKKYKRKWTEHLRRLLSQSGPKYKIGRASCRERVSA